MSHYLIIAPLSLLVVMVLYLGMYGLLNQQHTIDFKENESEFSFDDYQVSEIQHIYRTFSCGLGSSTSPTKAELWKETKAVLFLPYLCTLTISTDTNDIIKRPNVRKTSQSIINELIQKDPFATFEDNKPKPPYNQKLTLSWMPPMQYPYDARAIEGWVELEIKVNTQGTVDEIHIIAANPPRVFDRTAIRAYKKAKFLPEIINGKAVAKTIIQRINFKLAED